MYGTMQLTNAAPTVTSRQPVLLMGTLSALSTRWSRLHSPRIPAIVIAWAGGSGWGEVRSTPPLYVGRVSTYEDLRAAIMARPDLRIGTPATDTQIQAAQVQLGFLPADYQAFLSDFGWAVFGQWEIFGTGDNVRRRNDVVEITLSERARGTLPSTLVAVMNNGGGDLYCLDTNTVDAEMGSAAVVAWLHETSPQEGAEPVADRFSDWLIDLIAL